MEFIKKLSDDRVMKIVIQDNPSINTEKDDYYYKITSIIIDSIEIRKDKDYTLTKFAYVRCNGKMYFGLDIDKNTGKRIKEILDLESDVFFTILDEEARNIFENRLAPKGEQLLKESKESFQTLLAKAITENKKQKINSWIEPCNDKNEECNVDWVYEYINPDGTISKERYHTW